MSVDITRQELYDLVWSEPMTHAAKRFDISDVMLGRICEDRHVPRPPRGYWANLQSKSPQKRHFIKPPLPELPESDIGFSRYVSMEYKQREEARTDIFDPKDLSDPVRDPPPPFLESMDAFRKRIEDAFPDLVEPDRIKVLHPIVQKVLDYDLSLAAARKRDRYLFSCPQYQDEEGKLRLHLLNAFIMSFEALGFGVTLRGKKYFHFFTTIFGSYKEFHVFIKEYDPSSFERKKLGKVKRRTFCFSWTGEYEVISAGDMFYEFEIFNLDCIKRVIVDLVIKKEKHFRDWLVRSYKYNVEARKQAIEWHEKKIKWVAEAKRKALENLLASREKLMSEAVADMNHADKIRELIETMHSKAQSANRPVKGMKRWVGWAMHHANTIDPRHMSLESFEAWASKFKLKH